jgi:hypothetical protein
VVTRGDGHERYWLTRTFHIVTQALLQEAFDSEERAADLIFAKIPSAGRPLKRAALAHPLAGNIAPPEKRTAQPCDCAVRVLLKRLKQASC